MKNITSTSIMYEFENAQLGDQRLTKRLCRLAECFQHQPQASIPAATGSWGQACGAYRFFDNAEVDPADILASHTKRTLARAQTETLMLAVADTTSLNYSERPNTQGLGPIGNSTDKAFGLWVQSLLAFTPEGLPLGLLAAHSWARDPEQFGANHQRNQKPIEAKESYKWLRSYQVVQALAVHTPHTRWVMVADREADIYELFESAMGQPAGPELLIRLQHNRALEKPARRLLAHLARQPQVGTLMVAVPRKKNQPARRAKLELRFAPVRLRAPQLKSKRGPLALWAIEAREMHPPRGVTPICWRLLTTLAVHTLKHAIEKVQWYCIRWGIEVFHKVLKSACAVEEAQLEEAQRLQRLITVRLVVAWRVMWLDRLGREQAAAPISEILEEAEWKLLYAAVHRTSRLPRKKPTVREGVRWIAQMGGFLGRKGDGEPGSQTLARGLARLDAISFGWKLAHEMKNVRNV